MASIELHAPSDATTILRIAAVARDLGAAGLLRPTSEPDLAAFIDLSLNQYVGEFVGAISIAARSIFGNVEGDPIATGEVGMIVQSGGRLTRLLALSDRGSRSFDGAGSQPWGEGGFTGFPLAGVPALRFDLVATDISLQSGSLIGKYGAVVLGTGAPLATLLFFLTPFYADWHADRMSNHEIVRVTEHGRCSIDFAAELDIDALRKLAAEALVKAKPGQLDPVSLERRTCLTQVLLHLNDAYPGAIDGIEGPQTRQAEAAFAKREGIRATDIGGLPFYEALIAGVQRKRP